jgi:hypothetical protein
MRWHLGLANEPFRFSLTRESPFLTPIYLSSLLEIHLNMQKPGADEEN